LGYKGWVVRLDELKEKRLLGLMALVGDVAPAIFASRQRSGSIPTYVALKPRDMQQSAFAYRNI